MTTQRTMKPIDLDVFIEAVRLRPTLWDPRTDEYNNRDLRGEAWREVAETIIDDWSTFDEKVQLSKVQELQRKWKGLRDYFTREHKKEFLAKQKGKPIVYLKNRKHPTLDLLQFLKAVYKYEGDKNKGNKTLSSDDCTTMDCEDVGNSYVLPRAVYDSDSDSSSSPTPKKKPRTQNEREKKPEVKEKKMEQDPDMCFLLSILPEMKSMTADQNFDFRFEIMKIIKKIKSNIEGSDPLLT